MSNLVRNNDALKYDYITACWILFDYDALYYRHYLSVCLSVCLYVCGSNIVHSQVSVVRNVDFADAHTCEVVGGVHEGVRHGGRSLPTDVNFSCIPRRLALLDARHVARGRPACNEQVQLVCLGGAVMCSVDMSYDMSICLMSLVNYETNVDLTWQAWARRW